ncbi:MAG: TrbC/VirB2 family protein [Blastocatellia bacterium]
MNGHNNHVDVNHVNDINQLNVVSDNKHSSTLEPHLVKLKAKTVNLLVSSQELLSKRYARFIFVAVVTILVSAVDTLAVKDLKDVINDFKDFLYDDVRFALCVIGFAFGGFGLIFSKNPDTRKQALFVVLGAAFFAFAPGLLKFIADQTETDNPTDQ